MHSEVNRQLMPPVAAYALSEAAFVLPGRPVRQVVILEGRYPISPFAR